MTGPSSVEAAGALLWRDGGTTAEGVEVALVHRPKYDDWSLPKGKLEPGEHPLLAALREVEEETGARAVPGRPLAQTHYVKDGVPKRVRYWSMRHAGGEFSASNEIDRIRWLTLAAAQGALAPDRDGPVLDAFLQDPRRTRALVVVRHASAGDRDAWPGDDADRPLDETGRVQAAGLVDLLGAWAVSRAHSADVLRCLDTIGPFTARAGLAIESEPLLSESGFTAQPDAAVDRVVTIAREPGTAVVCTQDAALPDLVAGLCQALGSDPAALQPVEKGALVIVHLSCDDPTSVVAVEQLPPVP